MNLTPWLPHGAALKSFFEGNSDATIVVYDDHGDVDPLPVSYFFRDPSEFPETEMKALELCTGRVLDVGAGSGYHGLFLQERGFDVCSIEVLPDLVDVLTARGLNDVRQATMEQLSGETFDTVLILMNGIGLAGTVEGLPRFLRTAQALVNPGGQILADSTDLRGTENGSSTERADGRYLGEVTFQFEFEGKKGPPFPQIYADPDLLGEKVRATGWKFEVVCGGEHGAYLARIAQ